MKDLGLYLWASPGKQWKVEVEAGYNARQTADCVRQQGNKKAKHQTSPSSSLNNPPLTLLLQLKHVSHQTRLQLGFPSITAHSVSPLVHGCVPLFNFMFLKFKKN